MFTVIQFVTPVRSQLVEIELIYIDEFNYIELKFNFVLYKHTYSIKYKILPKKPRPNRNKLRCPLRGHGGREP